MAINVATAGIIVSKLEEIAKAHSLDFSPTIREIKLSVVYQIWLIGLAVLILTVRSSKVIQHACPEVCSPACDTLLLAIFICALDILRDTGMAIFVVMGRK